MDGLSLHQRMLQDPHFRESLEAAQTSGQKLHVLQNAGFSITQIQNVAKGVSNVAETIFEGSPPCK